MSSSVYFLGTDKEANAFRKRNGFAGLGFHRLTAIDELSSLIHPDAAVAWDRDVAPVLTFETLRLWAPQPNHQLHCWFVRVNDNYGGDHDCVWHCDPVPHWKVSRRWTSR